MLISPLLLVSVKYRRNEAFSWSNSSETSNEAIDELVVPVVSDELAALFGFAWCPSELAELPFFLSSSVDSLNDAREISTWSIKKH